MTSELLLQRYLGIFCGSTYTNQGSRPLALQSPRPGPTSEWRTPAENTWESNPSFWIGGV